AALDGLGDVAGAQFDVLDEHLDDSGMEPAPDDGELRIALAPCPHYRMVGEDRANACGVHADLGRDLRKLVAGPVELHRLHPYVSSDRCQILPRQRRCPNPTEAERTEAGTDSESAASAGDPHSDGSDRDAQ